MLHADGRNVIERALVVPLLVRVPVDMEELWRIRSLRPNGTYAHPKLMVPKDQLHCPDMYDGRFELRSDLQQWKDIVEYKKLRKSQAKGSKAAAEELLVLRGIQSLPSYLWRSSYFESHELTSLSDKLHQCFQGNSKRIQIFVLNAFFNTEHKYASAVIHLQIMFLL